MIRGDAMNEGTRVAAVCNVSVWLLAIVGAASIGEWALGGWLGAAAGLVGFAAVWRGLIHADAERFYWGCREPEDLRLFADRD